MLFDICFLGLPLSIAICLVVTALRVSQIKFWYPAVSLFAYCAFYLAGGREVLLYLTVAVLMGGGYLSAGGVAGAP